MQQAQNLYDFTINGTRMHRNVIQGFDSSTVKKKNHKKKIPLQKTILRMARTNLL